MKRILIIGLLPLSLLVFTGDDWQKFYDSSFDYFYNGEYDKAINYLEKALALNPKNPAIYWRLSCVLSQTALRDHFQNRDVNKELIDRFNEITNEGIRICNELLEVNKDNNSEILFYLGALYSHRGQFMVATTGLIKLIFKKGEVLGNIRKSREVLRGIKEGEPFYYEALGYLGFYNYGIVMTPRIARGEIKEDNRLSDKKITEWGLKELKLAMEHSRYSDDMKMLYLEILRQKIEDDDFKDRIDEALSLSEELMEKYPRNPSLRFNLVVLVWKKGELERAEEIAKDLCNELLLLVQNPGDFQREHLSYLYSRLAGVRAKIKFEKEKHKSHTNLLYGIFY